MQRFEYRAGGSAKFWAITSKGSTVEVVFGRIGTAGQTQLRSFDSPGAARANAKTQIAAKLAKGYREVRAGAAPATPSKHPFLFVGSGYGTSYKCLECFAWFERAPTKPQQAKIRALLPLPLTSIVKFTGDILHFGSDDTLELGVKAAYEPAHAKKKFGTAVSELYTAALAANWDEDALFPARATWKAFCVHFEKTMHDIHRIVPLRLVLKPDEQTSSNAWTQSSMLAAHHLFEPLLASKAKPTSAHAFITLNLMEGFDERVLKRMSNQARTVWLGWLDRLRAAGPRDLRDDTEDFALAILEAFPAREQQAVVARLSKSMQAVLKGNE